HRGDRAVVDRVGAGLVRGHEVLRGRRQERGPYRVEAIIETQETIRIGWAPQQIMVEPGDKAAVGRAVDGESGGEGVAWALAVDGVTVLIHRVADEVLDSGRDRQSINAIENLRSEDELEGLMVECVKVVDRHDRDRTTGSGQRLDTAGGESPRID